MKVSDSRGHFVAERVGEDEYGVCKARNVIGEILIIINNNSFQFLGPIISSFFNSLNFVSLPSFLLLPVFLLLFGMKQK